MSERGNEGAPSARPERGNEGAPPAQPEGDRGRGGLPWGKIIAAVIGLLLLVLLIPLACQALSGSSGGGNQGAGGGQETTGADQDSGQGGGSGTTTETTAPAGDTAAAEETTGAEGQQASGDGEATSTEAAGGAGGEQAGGERAGAASGSTVTAGFGAAAGGAVGQVGAEGGALDQTGDGTSVVVPRATISGTDGWMVVHRDEDGQPGAVIGAAALQEGDNTEVVVPLEEPVDTSQRLHAMIHADDPADGAYTFPEGDPPVEKGGEPVVETFRYTVGTLAAGEPVPDTGGPALLPLVGSTVLIGGLLLMLGSLMLRRRAPR